MCLCVGERERHRMGCRVHEKIQITIILIILFVTFIFNMYAVPSIFAILVSVSTDRVKQGELMFNVYYLQNKVLPLQK